MIYDEHGDPWDPGGVKPGLGGGLLLGVVLSVLAVLVAVGGAGEDGLAGELARGLGTWWGPVSWVLAAPLLAALEARPTVVGMLVATTLAWPVVAVLPVLATLGG